MRQVRERSPSTEKFRLGWCQSLSIKMLALGSAFLLLYATSLVCAIVIDPSTQFLVQNETYTANATMVFDQIIINETYIMFNETGFYVTAPNNITIVLVYSASDVAGALNGELVLDFYATTASGTVEFNLSGFPVNNEYAVHRNGNSYTTCTASVLGMISFTKAAWGSTQRFQVYQQVQAPVDSLEIDGGS